MMTQARFYQLVDEAGPVYAYRLLQLLMLVRSRGFIHQEDIAKATGYTSAYVSRVLNGRRIVPVATLDRMDDAIDKLTRREHERLRRAARRQGATGGVERDGLRARPAPLGGVVPADSR